jgi:hypothetical protein
MACTVIIVGKHDQRLASLIARMDDLDRFYFENQFWTPVSKVALAIPADDDKSIIGLASLGPEDERGINTSTGERVPTILGCWVDPIFRNWDIDIQLFLALGKECKSLYQKPAKIFAFWKRQLERARMAVLISNGTLIVEDLTIN